jgi:transcriptional regulator with XRE-family HTH domain
MEETTNSKRGNPGLKALREMAKLNRKTMAKATGVTSRMWQIYENEGENPDRVSTLIRIAVLAGVSIDEAIQMIGYPVPTREQLIAETESAQGTA